MNFRLAPSAITDIEAILQHLTVESPTGAIAVAARLDEVFRGIEDFPGFGKRTDRKGIGWTNTHPYPYLIFYKTSPSSTDDSGRSARRPQSAVHACRTSLSNGCTPWRPA